MPFAQIPHKCTDPGCYQSKVQAHIAAAVASKPQLVRISTSYRAPVEGSTVLSRNKYVAVREEKRKDKEQAKQPEFKTCKDTLTAIIADGEGQGTIQKVCMNPLYRVHHRKDERRVQDEASRANWKAKQEKQRREEAIANTTGLRVLSAIDSAVPVRLLKRDLLFIAERLLSLMDENRIEAIARQQGIRQKRDDGGVRKTLTAFLRRADEGTLSRLLVEASILLAVSRQCHCYPQRRRHRLQGGHRCHRHQGQSGVRQKGEVEDSEAR